MPKRVPAGDPETRVGNCCGCHRHSLLFKVPRSISEFRYRCDECYEKEVGVRHYLAPSRVVPA